MVEVHDKKIIGMLYTQDNNKLIFYLNNDESIIFNNVSFFKIDNFSDENVIFEIFKFNSNNVPSHLLESYPSLLGFVESDLNYEISYINSSVGAEGVIVINI